MGEHLGYGVYSNVKKCKVMHLGYNNTGHIYTMNNQQLEVTADERDIGAVVGKHPD